MMPPVAYRSFGAFRLLLALLVLVQHSLRGLAPPELSDPLLPMEIGSTAVLLFFVLSGFIVTEAADRVYATRPFAFLTNRVIRVYPTYLLALAMTIGVIALLRSVGQGATVSTVLNAKVGLSDTNILANLFAILPGSNTLIDKSGGSSILALAWALRIEMVFYVVLFAHLAAAAVLKVSVGRLLAISGVCGLAAYAALLPALRDGGLEFFPYFALGVAGYFADRDRSLVGAGIASAALILVGIHLGFQPTRVSIVPMIEMGGGLAALATIIWGGGGLPSATTVARDRYLGDMTYPLYLTHICGLLIAGAVFPLNSSLALIGGVLASIAIAHATTELFERRLSLLRASVRRFALTAQAHDCVPLAGAPNRNGRIISGRALRV